MEAAKNPMVVRKPDFNTFLLQSKEYIRSHVNNSGKSYSYIFTVFIKTIKRTLKMLCDL